MRTCGRGRGDGDEVHGHSLTDAGSGRHSIALVRRWNGGIRRAPCGRVGHHRGVPMEPFSPFDPYGGEPEPHDLSGYLLVATPACEDPNFSRRVVLVLDHGLHGALGVVIDRPGGVAVDRLLPQWHSVGHDAGGAVHRGPVARNSLIGLVRLTGRAPRRGGRTRPTRRVAAPGGRRPTGGNGRPRGRPGPLRRIPRGRPPVLGLRRVGVGPVGGRDRRRAWYVVRPEARDPISADPEGLWRRVLRRQGGALALVSGFPSDPAAN